MKGSSVFPFIFFVFLIFSCSHSDKNVKLKKYIVAGERIFEKNCANCHQKDGSGFRGLYPAIDPNTFRKMDKKGILCLLKKGSNLTSTDKNIQINPIMPPSDLSNLDIAEVYTYIYNTWSGTEGLTEVSEVNQLINNCSVP